MDVDHKAFRNCTTVTQVWVDGVSANYTVEFRKLLSWSSCLLDITQLLNQHAKSNFLEEFKPNSKKSNLKQVFSCREIKQKP